MKKLLKLSTVLLTALTIGVGVAAGTGIKEVKNAQAVTTFNKINETCFLKVDGSGTDAHFVIHLTNWDYAVSDEVHIYEGSYSTYESKFEALDTINYLKINNESVNFDTYNSEGFKLKKEIHINAHEPRNTISFRIGFEGSKTASDISSISIDKGCLLPSKGYFDGTSTNAYCISSNVTAVRENVNWGWLTYIDTEVYNVYTFENTYLALFLSVNDFPANFRDGNLSYPNFTNFSNGTNLVLNNGVSAVEGYGLFNYQGRANSIWIQTSANSSQVSSVTVKEGLILPSFHCLNWSGTNPAWPMVFNVSNTYTFTVQNGNWQPLYDAEETSVSELDFTSINGEWLSFKLSNSNYSTYRQAAFSASKSYNLWTNIKIYDKSGNAYTLNDVAETGHIFNFNNANEGEISFNIKTAYRGDFIYKIVIPAGTQFPDFEFINGTITSRPKAYEIQEEQTFIYALNANSGVVYAKVIDTEITGMALVNGQYLGFTLSNNDYPAAGTVSGVNDRNRETTISNFASKVDVSNVNTAIRDTSYSLWSYGTNANTIFITLDDTNISAGIITIATDALFPSYEYSKDRSVYPTVYRTTSQYKFKYDGSIFKNISEPWAINTTISALGSHGNYSSNDCAIDLYTTQFDWPESMADVVLNSIIPSFSTKYNLSDYILCYDTDDNLITFTSEFFVNVWGAKGCYSLRLTNAANSMKRLNYVVIKEGLKLPTYAGEYTTGQITDNSYYLIDKTVVFTHDYNSHTFNKVTYLEHDTNVNSLKEINNYDQNSFLSLSISNHDYSSLTENVNIRILDRSEMNKLNLEDYITVNGKKLSEWENFDSFGIYVTSKGEILFAKEGNNTGYYYLEGGKRVYTADTTVYEVSIAAGCQFPSYEYLSGQVNVPECYSVTKDYRFAYFNGNYVLEDANFENIEVNKIKINNAGLKVVNSSDKCLYLSLDSTDWPAGNVASDVVLSNVGRFLSQIEVFDKNGNLHTPTSTEIFVNVWGSGANGPVIGFRTDINDINDVDYIRVHTGTLIPSYANYSSGGVNNSWYEVVLTQSLYSSFDGAFYSADKTITANNFAKQFNSAFNEVCGGYTGLTSNKERLTNKFHAFANIYNNELSDAQKALLVHGKDGVINDMLETYIYVVSKYGLNNFLGVSSIETRSNTLNLFVSGVNGDTTILVIAVLTILCLPVILILIKKRKANI